METHTMIEKVKIKCPKCGEESDFDMYKRIDATPENGLRNRLLDNSLFTLYCSHCSCKINVEHSFLYNQLEDNYIVHCCVNDKDAQDVINLLTKPTEEQKPVVNSLAKNNTMIRLVRSRQMLIEKLCIYDMGMDDRVIEVYKHMVAGSYLKDHPEDKISKLLFDAVKQQGEEEYHKIIRIYVDDKNVAQAEIIPETYKKIFDDFISAMPVMRADKNLIVNASWAKSIIDLKNAAANPADA